MIIQHNYIIIIKYLFSENSNKYKIILYDNAKNSLFKKNTVIIIILKYLPSYILQINSIKLVLSKIKLILNYNNNLNIKYTINKAF